MKVFNIKVIKKISENKIAGQIDLRAHRYQLKPLDSFTHTSLATKWKIVW